MILFFLWLCFQMTVDVLLMLNFLREHGNGSRKLQNLKLDISFSLFNFSRGFLPQDKDIQHSRYVDSKFSHFVRSPPSVAVLCPNVCRRIISDLIEFFISYFGRRRCHYDALIFQFTEIEDLGVTHRLPERRQAIVGLNLKNHDSYLEFTDTVIHEFTHVLETMNDDDHGVEFAGIFRGLLSLVHSQEIDMSYAGVNQCDLQSIQASVECRG